MRDYLEFVGAGIAAVVTFVFVVALPLCGLTYASGYVECNAKAKALGLTEDFGLFQGCFVESAGEKLPLETYLARKVEQNVNVRVQK